jgi:hypothetical protein
VEGREDSEAMRRIALSWRYEGLAIAIILLVLACLFTSLPWWPGPHGTVSIWTFEERVMHGVALLFFFAAGVSVILEFRKRSKAFFLWNDHNLAFEKDGRIVWEMPWTDYDGLDLRRMPLYPFKGVNIKSRSSDRHSTLPLGDMSRASSTVVLRLLTLAAEDQAQVQRALSPQPKKPSIRYIIAVFAVSIGLMVVGYPSTHKVFQASQGLVTGDITTTDLILAFLSTCVSPALFLGAIGLCYRRYAKEVDQPMPKKVERCLADTLRYGDVPGSPPCNTIYTYGDGIEAKRILRSISQVCLPLALVSPVVSVTVGIGLGLEQKSLGGWVAAAGWIFLWMSFAILFIRDIPKLKKCLSSLDMQVILGNNGEIAVVRGDRQLKVNRVHPKAFSNVNANDVSRIVSLETENEVFWVSPALLKPVTDARMGVGR